MFALKWFFSNVFCVNWAELKESEVWSPKNDVGKWNALVDLKIDTFRNKIL